MLNCYQFEHMNMLQHGQKVHQKYLYLLSNPHLISDNTKLLYWLFEKQLPIETMRIYHWYHDCGKPDCRVIDELGKQHFPNHASISADKFKLYASELDSCKLITQLILMDMDFHTKRCGDLDLLCQHELAPSLYLTALAEIHANCEMFGGIESTSFKIKHKWLKKCAKKLAEINEVYHGK